MPNHPGHINPSNDSGEPRETEDEPREAGGGGRSSPWRRGVETASNQPRVRLKDQLTTLLLRNCPPSTHPNTMYLLRLRESGCLHTFMRLSSFYPAAYMQKSVSMSLVALSCIQTFIQELALTNMAAPPTPRNSKCAPEHHVLSS